jgi:hypothetical protein
MDTKLGIFQNLFLEVLFLEQIQEWLVLEFYWMNHKAIVVILGFSVKALLHGQTWHFWN